MIALDTSALLAPIFAKPDGPDLLAVIECAPCVIGAPTAFEARMVVAARGSTDSVEALELILAQRNVSIVPFEADHASLARDAYATYGKGRGHPAQLNFGDCMAYAVAKRDDLPLLYKGDDFARTDLRPARATA